MRAHILLWFMVFVLVVFVLFWIFQILFLQNFYNRMKTNDIVHTAEKMRVIYESGDYENAFRALAIENDMCVEVRDRYERSVYSQDVMGVNCFLHGLSNRSREIIRLVRNSDHGAVCGKVTNQITQTDILIYGCIIGSKDDPQGYLLLNAPLVPVASNVSILRRQLVIITGLLVIFGFALSMIVSKRLAKPIARITEDAGRLAHGRYDIEFRAGGYDEADRLAETLTYASYEINRVDAMQRDLLANASHDLRTPLTMLKAYAEMIRDLSGDNPVKRAEHLQVIIEETDRLTALVNDILDLSKYENGRQTLDCSVLDMEQRLHEIVERYRGLSTVSGFTFTLETDGEATVCCDAGKIEQVICNLINNAMNYTGEDKQIFIRQQHTAEGLRISVRDTGNGMDSETLSRIFDKYYRSENYRRSVAGTGLGLSIVKAILRLHDYAFGVDSKVGEGSDFWFIMHGEPVKQKNDR